MSLKTGKSPKAWELKHRQIKNTAEIYSNMPKGSKTWPCTSAMWLKASFLACLPGRTALWWWVSKFLRLGCAVRKNISSCFCAQFSFLFPLGFTITPHQDEIIITFEMIRVSVKSWIHAIVLKINLYWWADVEWSVGVCYDAIVHPLEGHSAFQKRNSWGQRSNKMTCHCCVSLLKLLTSCCTRTKTCNCKVCGDFEYQMYLLGGCYSRRS